MGLGLFYYSIAMDPWPPLHKLYIYIYEIDFFFLLIVISFLGLVYIYIYFFWFFDLWILDCFPDLLFYVLFVIVILSKYKYKLQLSSSLKSYIFHIISFLHKKFSFFVSFFCTTSWFFLIPLFSLKELTSFFSPCTQHTAFLMQTEILQPSQVSSSFSRSLKVSLANSNFLALPALWPPQTYRRRCLCSLVHSTGTNVRFKHSLLNVQNHHTILQPQPAPSRDLARMVLGQPKGHWPPSWAVKLSRCLWSRNPRVAARM